MKEREMTMPSAKLVALTQGVEGATIGELLAEAFAQCYQKKASLDIVLRNMRHKSVLEHVSFTFQVNMSRVCWEQLVRHRIASYTAQSHRYTEITPADMLAYIPSEVEKLGEEVIEEWCDDMLATYATYKKWLDKGIKKESARYHIAKGVGISARVTFNLASLINMLTLRTDSHAQEEIQMFAWECWSAIKPHMPITLYTKIQQTYFPEV